MRTHTLLFAASFTAFVLASRGALAQDAAPTSALESPTSLPEAAPAEDQAAEESAPARTAAPARFELAQRLGYYSGAWAGGTTETSFGVVLSDRLVWLSGASVGFTQREYGTSSERSLFWAGATGLKIYATSPHAGRLSPTFKLLAVYRGSASESQYEANPSRQTTMHLLGGSASAGLTYFVTEHLGILLECGLEAAGTVGSHLSGPPELYRNTGNTEVATTVGVSAVLRR